MPRISLSPVDPDRPDGAYALKLDDVDVSTLVRRVQVDLTAGSPATVTLTLGPAAVDADLPESVVSTIRDVEVEPAPLIDAAGVARAIRRHIENDEEIR
jgi:hypothetical protein